MWSIFFISYALLLSLWLIQSLAAHLWSDPIWLCPSFVRVHTISCPFSIPSCTYSDPHFLSSWSRAWDCAVVHPVAMAISFFEYWSLNPSLATTISVFLPLHFSSNLLWCLASIFALVHLIILFFLIYIQSICLKLRLMGMPLVLNHCSWGNPSATICFPNWTSCFTSRVGSRCPPEQNSDWMGSTWTLGPGEELISTWW